MAAAISPADPLHGEYGPRQWPHVSGFLANGQKTMLRRLTTIRGTYLEPAKRCFWRRRRDSNPRDPFEPNGFQDRRIQPLTHSSVSKYNLQQLLAEFLLTVLGPAAAFWCILSPNCH